jgi:hypothetical protein
VNRDVATRCEFKRDELEDEVIGGNVLVLPMVGLQSTVDFMGVFETIDNSSVGRVDSGVDETDDLGVIPLVGREGSVDSFEDEVVKFFRLQEVEEPFVPYEEVATGEFSDRGDLQEKVGSRITHGEQEDREGGRYGVMASD